MGVTSLQEQGKTRITLEQFNELAYQSGRTPHDMVEEKGRLGVIFSIEGRGQVRIWWVEGSGCFIEGKTSFEDAKRILAP